jgi:hypothetical protein
MKISVSQPYIRQFEDRIAEVLATAKTFDWEQIGDDKAANYWYEKFRDTSYEVVKFRELSDKENAFVGADSLLANLMVQGRAKFKTIIDVGF